MRMFLSVLFASVLSVLAANVPAMAGEKGSCVGSACNILQRGHVRGRLPLACVSIPFVKEGYGKVAIFILQDFDPEQANESDEALQRQLDKAVAHDSKVTGPLDDFCRNPKFFQGGRWAVLCDEHHHGSIGGESYQYAIRHGHPPSNRRVRIGTHV